MIAKLFELRDKKTFVPVLAVLVEPDNDQEEYLLRRAGYGVDQFDRLVILTGLDGGTDKSTCDPHEWDNRTRHFAHKHIAEHWSDLETGAVIDVEFILGESAAPKRSEKEET
jgi:hypothetical protein